MRKSLQNLPLGFVRQDVGYKNMPDELQPYAYYLMDSGHCVMAIPESLLQEAEEENDYDGSEVPIPTKYVLTRGYRMVHGYVVVEAEYSRDIGLVVDEKYNEY